MKIVGEYSFNNGFQYVQEHFPQELKEIREIIGEIRAEDTKNKVSEESTTNGEIFYSPGELNTFFKIGFKNRRWADDVRVKCDYPTNFYVDGYNPPRTKNAFRGMDFVKNRLGVEVQFGKYSFMVYNVSAKMTIFRNLDIIEAGVEIVPVREMANQMSSGVSYFEQFIWDLGERGISDIDIPVLIIGICPEKIASLYQNQQTNLFDL